MAKPRSLKQKLKQALQRRQRNVINDSHRVPAAVLLPLYEEAGRYHLLFTQRTLKVKDHRGEVSFPGGVCRREDKSLLDTALRESFEEIGLVPKDVEILGALDDTPTSTTNYLVSPFLGVIPHPYTFCINADEVEQVIGIPLEVLLEEAEFSHKPSADKDKPAPEYRYVYRDTVIWGATARILKQFLDIVRQL